VRGIYRTAAALLLAIIVPAVAQEQKKMRNLFSVPVDFAKGFNRAMRYEFKPKDGLAFLYHDVNGNGVIDVSMGYILCVADPTRTIEPGSRWEGIVTREPIVIHDANRVVMHTDGNLDGLVDASTANPGEQPIWVSTLSCEALAASPDKYYGLKVNPPSNLFLGKTIIGNP